MSANTRSTGKPSMTHRPTCIPTTNWERERGDTIKEWHEVPGQTSDTLRQRDSLRPQCGSSSGSHNAIVAGTSSPPLEAGM